MVCFFYYVRPEGINRNCCREAIPLGCRTACFRHTIELNLSVCGCVCVSVRTNENTGISLFFVKRGILMKYSVPPIITLHCDSISKGGNYLYSIFFGIQCSQTFLFTVLENKKFTDNASRYLELDCV